MVHLEICLLETQTKPERRKGYDALPQTLIARGLHKESRIDLFCVKEGETERASVFIYPLGHYEIDDQNITDVNPRLKLLDSPSTISRKFKNMAVEDLNSKFMEKLKPLLPYFTNEYALHRPKITEHCFPLLAIEYIRQEIKEFKF